MKVTAMTDHGRAGLSEDERKSLRGGLCNPSFACYPAAIAAVEAILAARMADAWDEGQRAGFRFYREHVPFADRDRNPYRRQP